MVHYNIAAFTQLNIKSNVETVGLPLTLSSHTDSHGFLIWISF